MKRCVRPAVLLLAALLTAACGGDGSNGGAAGSSASTTAGAGSADQTVEITMVDIDFKPKAVTVKAGTTVRFVFKNTGDLEHNAAFGDEATQQAVESGKQQRDGIAAGPGQTKTYTRRFDTAGALIIGCHAAGHYAAGMKIQLTIA